MYTKIISNEKETPPLSDEETPLIDKIFPSLSWEVQQELKLLFKCRQILFKLHPFKVGDNVKIIDPSKITKEVTPGWMGYKHLLSSDSVGRVASRSCEEGLWCILFEVVETFWVVLAIDMN